MKTRFIGFGRLEIDGTTYTEDVMVVNSSVVPREKAISRQLKGRYGHTPLSEGEPIPWDCSTLVVGTGVRGMLPITDEVHALAEERGVELVAVPTEEACAVLNNADLDSTNAILHLTC